MNFLYPLLFYGFFFTAIPIIYHFIGRFRKKVIPFPIIFAFSKSATQVNFRIRLKELLVLLLRLLVISLLCLAFAYPMLPTQEVPIEDTSIYQANLIFVDTSQSMYRKNKGAEDNLLMEALSNIKKLWSELSKDRVILVFNDNDLKNLAFGSLEQREKQLRYLESLALKNETEIGIDTNYPAALLQTTLKTLKEASFEENYKWTTYIFSDFQKKDWDHFTIDGNQWAFQFFYLGKSQDYIRINSTSFDHYPIWSSEPCGISMKVSHYLQEKDMAKLQIYINNNLKLEESIEIPIEKDFELNRIIIPKVQGNISVKIAIEKQGYNSKIEYEFKTIIYNNLVSRELIPQNNIINYAHFFREGLFLEQERILKKIQFLNGFENMSANEDFLLGFNLSTYLSDTKSLSNLAPKGKRIVFLSSSDVPALLSNYLSLVKIKDDIRFEGYIDRKIDKKMNLNNIEQNPFSALASYLDEIEFKKFMKISLNPQKWITHISLGKDIPILIEHQEASLMLCLIPLDIENTKLLWSPAFPLLLQLERDQLFSRDSQHPDLPIIDEEEYLWEQLPSDKLFSNITNAKSVLIDQQWVENFVNPLEKSEKTPEPLSQFFLIGLLAILALFVVESFLHFRS